MKMTCPHCHAEFYIARGLLTDYVYKINKTYYCSYKCWRQHGGGDECKGQKCSLLITRDSDVTSVNDKNDYFINKKD